MISLLNNFNNSSHLLEPCGGDGAFISVILEKSLLKPNQITVWDINPEVRNVMLDSNVHFEVKDTLLETDFVLDSLFTKVEKYTHIVGNPPYLNKQSEYIKKHKFKLKKYIVKSG
jgi:methylase of polypeptide subunit release factors